MLNQKRESVWCDLLFLALLVISALLVVSTFRYVIFADGADEGYYLRYAARVSKEGIISFRPMFAEYIAQKEHWLFPNPLRIAFILMSGLWVKIWGVSYEALAALSFCCYLGTLCVSYYYCKKHLGSIVALLFTLLMAFSPLNMAMARRALVDGPANLCAILSVWLLYEAAWEKGWMRKALFAGIYAVTILMKEIMVLLAPVFAVYLVIMKCTGKRQLPLRDLVLMTACPPLIALAAWLWAAGDASNVFAVVKIIMASPASNSYALMYCSGSWIRYIVDFMLLSPWVCILAIGYFFSRICISQRRELDRYFSVIGVCYFIFLIFFVKNIRYAMLLDTPLRLFAVLMIQRLAEAYAPRHAIAVCALCVVSIALFDYILFYNVFILHMVYDPVSIYLLYERRLIPSG